MYTFGYLMLMFGLLSRIAQPTDSTARVIIVIGGGLLVIPFLRMLGHTFSFTGLGIFEIIQHLLNFLVTALGVFCILFIAPPQKLPPALRAIDSLGPPIAAVLLGWLVIGPTIEIIGLLIHGDLINGLLLLARYLLYIVAFVGVFLTAAPNVYESLFKHPVMDRSPLATLGYCFVPLFAVYWFVETKEELKKRTGMALPSGWWFAVPGGGIYFIWKWAEAVEKATGYSKMNAFLLCLFIAPFGVYTVQGKFNQMVGAGGAGLPQAYVAAGGQPGYPPQGGGYPPQGGGYPPQQGGQGGGWQ